MAQRLFIDPLISPPIVFVTHRIARSTRSLVLSGTLDAGGAWSYHAYSIQYTADEGIESWYSLRYRRFYDFLGRQHPDLLLLPMILTEGGAGQDGWRPGGAARFENWLTWFDAEISQDGYILGVTLFEIGDSQGWPNFDLEPVAGWLSDYLSTH